jgi:modulator of FtsH protease HflK
MPWSNQTGGGGPWGSGSRGPWGSGPQPSGGGSRPPDLEEFLRRSQDRLRNVLPGNLGGRGIALIALVALALWGFSGFYRVEPDEVGVVLRFGKFVPPEVPQGLNYHLPYPIETALTPPALRVNKTDVGIRPVEDLRRGSSMRELPEESLMLTGDENIVDVEFSVLWRIKPGNVSDYLFNVQNPEGTVKAVAESAMREVIGRLNVQPLLTGGSKVQQDKTDTSVQDLVQNLMQKTLDSYSAGILIQNVQISRINPPAEVMDSFLDVQAARSDSERAQNEAQTYANRVVPEARGRAAKILQDADAYREQAVAEAKGETSRFLQIYEQYKKAPTVTRERMYLETMERILSDTNKTIIDTGRSGPGVVPYLPLTDLPVPPSRTPRAGTSSTGGTQ